MSKQDDCEQYAGVMLSRRRGMRVDQAYLLALAERWLRPADQLDYMIRRGVIPVPFEAGRSVAPASPLRRSFLKHSRRVGRSIPHKGASMRSNGSLSEVQATIGRCLRAEAPPVNANHRDPGVHYVSWLWPRRPASRYAGPRRHASRGVLRVEGPVLAHGALTGRTGASLPHRPWPTRSP